MSTTTDQVFATPEGKFLVDPYDIWARAQDVPVLTGGAIDLLAVETRPWARFDVKGAICHLDGRDDFLTLFVQDIAPGAARAPTRHLHEELCYGLAGRGVAEIDLPGGGKTSVEWDPGVLFSAPMNARVRLRNTSTETARVACVTDLRYLLSLYRNERFLFDTPMEFPARADGDYMRDCLAAPAGDMIRPNESVLPIALAKGSIGADLVEIAANKHGRAERRMFGSLLLGVAGEGMTLSWSEEPDSPTQTRWRHGVAFAPAGMTFHQQFNVGDRAARYLSIDLGSVAAPMFRPRRRAYGDADVYAAGSAVIETADQDARIEAIWRAAMGET